MTEPTARPSHWPKRPDLNIRPDRIATELDAFIPRKTAELAPGEDAWGKLSAEYFEPLCAFTMEEHEAGVEMLAGMCGLVVRACLKPTLKSLRAASRFLLNNVSLGEAAEVIEQLDEKSREWWLTKGKPMGAATNIINEISKAKSAEVLETLAYDKYNQDKVDTAADVARRRKYLE